MSERRVSHRRVSGGGGAADLPAGFPGGGGGGDRGGGRCRRGGAEGTAWLREGVALAAAEVSHFCSLLFAFASRGIGFIGCFCLGKGYWILSISGWGGTGEMEIGLEFG